jgi:hypothetical protein
LFLGFFVKLFLGYWALLFLGFFVAGAVNAPVTGGGFLPSGGLAGSAL